MELEFWNLRISTVRYSLLLTYTCRYVFFKRWHFIIRIHFSWLFGERKYRFMEFVFCDTSSVSPEHLYTLYNKTWQLGMWKKRRILASLLSDFIKSFVIRLCVNIRFVCCRHNSEFISFFYSQSEIEARSNTETSHAIKMEWTKWEENNKNSICIVKTVKRSRLADTCEIGANSSVSEWEHKSGEKCCDNNAWMIFVFIWPTFYVQVDLAKN